ncbi:glycosyltransferase family 39 protein [Rhodopirellula sp. JC639]|uniref:glycosyltransferase family 39 protein n=1 Tax=Stieleria mannarensis TaxID=2755585 RepID=UPI0016032340|nr:glycosyltransferase family 39 protein [Rhodopirellula sp. JC639]
MVDDYQARTEFVQAQAFSRDNGTESLKLFHIARLSTIPWCVLGTLLIWHIAATLYSPQAGAVAAILWAFSPSILTFGATIVPDVPAAVCGLLVAIVFARWLERPSWSMTFACGAAVGLAFSVKFTWFLLLPILPLTLLALQLGNNHLRGYQRWIRLCVIFGIATTFLHLIYAGDRTFLSLAQYQFKSTTFASIQDFFANHPGLRVIAGMPIPLPENVLKGLDVQKADFEGGHYQSYLFGQWQSRGWWYYYLVGWLMKEPVGLWGLVAAGAWAQLRAAHPLSTLHWVVFAITVPVFIVVSAETGFNMHLRYVLPALPAVYLLAAAAFTSNSPTRKVKCFLVLAFVVASLSVMPRSYSFFPMPLAGQKTAGNC